MAAWSAGGKKKQDSETILFDIPDGLLFQTHPELSKPDATGTVRLAFILYYDDIQVNNPLGFARGLNEVRHEAGHSPNYQANLLL